MFKTLADLILQLKVRIRMASLKIHNPLLYIPKVAQVIKGKNLAFKIMNHFYPQFFQVNNIA